jgi:hypothetical protein
MQIISVTFGLAMFEFWRMESELLGCQKGKCSGTFLDFPKKINETYRFFGILDSGGFI